MGRHSKNYLAAQRGRRPARVTDARILGRFRWHRSSTQAVVPVQRISGIEVIDTETRLAHQVSPDELVAGLQRGEYQGFCGARFRAASMVEPGRGQCRPCREQAM
jgi:hypothetical protein